MYSPIDKYSLAANLLADSIIVVITFTFSEEDFHRFRHVDPEEHIWIAEKSRDTGEHSGLNNRVFSKVLFTKRLRSQIPLNYKCTVKTSEDAEHNEENQFEEVPCAIIFHLKHDKLPCSERIHCLRLG